MNIRTIGDLLRTTEAELLSYKNFGETSLSEIKGILNSKNLRLGMALEDKNLMSSKPQAQPENETTVENKPVDDLEISVRAKKCLQNLDIRTIGELLSHSETELLNCKNFGMTSLSEIKQRLSNVGLSLKKSD